MEIWQMIGWGLVLFGIYAVLAAIAENRKDVDELTIDMHIPGERHFYEWLSGGAEEGLLMEAAVLDSGFTDFYKLKVRKNQVVGREKFDTVAFKLESKDFPMLVKMVRQNSPESGQTNRRG